MAAAGRTRLVVLYGGRSAEHEVSCVSARHVADAVDPDRYELVLVGITTDGRWVDTTALGSGTRGALPSPDDAGGGGALLPESVGVGSGDVVVLPLVHGPMGEDGTVQGLLELAGLPYCGPGVAGCAVAMDKGLTKALFSAAGLPQARWIDFHESEAAEKLTSAIGERLGWPVFVKPANMGSSIGITKVHRPEDMAKAVAKALQYDERLVIEEAVTGREIEMGVLGWPDLRTSVPGEILPSHEFYDYDDKYVDGTAGLEVPASLPEEVVKEMSVLAIRACLALRVDSMARVDFFYEEGGRGLLINEVNTIPGFTPISMFPRMWAASGVGYAQLIDTLVDQARRRAARRSRFETHR